MKINKVASWVMIFLFVVAMHAFYAYCPEVKSLNNATLWDFIFPLAYVAVFDLILIANLILISQQSFEKVLTRVLFVGALSICLQVLPYLTSKYLVSSCV